MDDVLAKSKTGRRVARNVVAGLCGLAGALALALSALRAGGFLPEWFAVVVIYLLPLPVACGLAVGFVSPKRVIAWAPLWSGILAVLMSSILCGARAFAEIPWSIVIGLTAVGAIVAALSGYGGQRAAKRGYVARSVLAVIVVCCAMGGAGYMLLQSQERSFAVEGKPQILLELDRDYFALPRGMNWSCDRQIATGSYVLTSQLNGQPMRVYALAGAAALCYVHYELPGGRAELPTKEDARRYLKTLGVRDPFISGLATGRGYWRSVLRGTRLTIWPTGRVRFDSVPPRIPEPAPKGDR
jgi:hypothetical protein